MEQAPPPVRDPERDTIAAIATPPGTGALAIVRVSGPGAVAVADAVFCGRGSLRTAASHTAHYGAIVRVPDDRSGAGAGEVIDDVVATVFRAPASYTGDDTVEITCHGSNLVAATIVGALLNEGARNADPGEFTRRAFLNGKLDLTQAEAVAEVIRSATAASLRGARNRLTAPWGRASRRCGSNCWTAPCMWSWRWTSPTRTLSWRRRSWSPPRCGRCAPPSTPCSPPSVPGACCATASTWCWPGRPTSASRRC